jgi:subtilase family serine protease
MKRTIGGSVAKRHPGVLAVIAAVVVLTSACGDGHPSSAATSTTTALNSTGAVVSTDCLTLRTSPCYTPKQLRAAYGIQSLLDRGITGRGTTVVLPEFPPSTGSPSTTTGVPADSDIRRDLADFDSQFHLPAARLQVVNTLAHVASPWSATGEEVADTEIVHAVAPDATIREVLIPSSDTASTTKVTTAVVAALRLGLGHSDVVSLSADAGEQCFTPIEVAQFNSVLLDAERDRVTVAVSSGDSGAATDPCPGTPSAPVKGVDLPASDPLALAVGGTTLQLDRSTGAYIGETAWNIQDGSSPEASNGGFSKLFPRPAYQDGIAGIGTTRGVPDVAAVADPTAGMALTISDGSHGHGYAITEAGGTSVATPLWAGIVVLADQDAGRSLGFINPVLYRIGRSASYHQAFHDVVTGTNTVNLAAGTVTGYRAAAGWDPITGWGSPNAQGLVPLVTRYAGQ